MLVYQSDTVHDMCWHRVSLVFLSDEGSTLETLDFNIKIGSTPSLDDLFAAKTYSRQTIVWFFITWLSRYGNMENIF